MSYEISASFYDSLTKNVDYDLYAEYIKSVFDKYSSDVKIVLDIACGTGTLTQKLSEAGYDMIGTDLSESMLSVAVNKASQSGRQILYLCQGMDELDLYGTVDAAVCTLDSINHVEDKSVISEMFRKVSLFMNRGGIFLFDVNSLYKHRDVLGDNTFVYETEDVYCVWQNFYEESDSSVDIELDFFERDDDVYVRHFESFTEFYYSDDELTKMLENAGFELLERHNGWTFEDVDETTERIIYIARKK